MRKFFDGKSPAFIEVSDKARRIYAYRVIIREYLLYVLAHYRRDAGVYDRDPVVEFRYALDNLLKPVCGTEYDLVLNYECAVECVGNCHISVVVAARRAVYDYTHIGYARKRGCRARHCAGIEGVGAYPRLPAFNFRNGTCPLFP